MATKTEKEFLKSELINIKKECDARSNGEYGNAYLAISIKLTHFIQIIDGFDASLLSINVISGLEYLINTAIDALKHGTHKQAINALNNLITQLANLFPSITTY